MLEMQMCWLLFALSLGNTVYVCISTMILSIYAFILLVKIERKESIILSTYVTDCTKIAEVEM